MRKTLATAACSLLLLGSLAAQPLRSLADDPQPPTLHALLMAPDQAAPAPDRKVLLLFKTEKQASTWATATGLAAIAAGAYLGGKAEMHRMYHGTTRDWDTFHVTRDAGLLCTGLGAGALGASVAIGDHLKWTDLIWKAATGAILYRCIAQATYNATKPRP